jgi:hypothetical protein
MENATSARPVSLYSYSGEFLDHISLARTLREEVTGRVRVVRHRKGHVNRAILLRRPGDPEAFTLRDYQGRAYSFRQSLDDGRHCWKLRPLQGGRSEGNLAPESLRPIFTEVLRGCIVAA